MSRYAGSPTSPLGGEPGPSASRAGRDGHVRIVVTGATGSAGTALLRDLASDSNHEVVGVARRLPDSRQPPYDIAEWVQCDIGSPDAGRTLREVCDGADTVVHLAWAVHPRTDEPPRHRTNVTGSRVQPRQGGSRRSPRRLSWCTPTTSRQRCERSSIAGYTPAGSGWPTRCPRCRRSGPGSSWAGSRGTTPLARWRSW